MLESAVEGYLKKEVKRLGGLAIKLSAPGFGGIPDRMVLLPGGRVFFIELKAPGETPRKLQLKWIKRLRALGFYASYIDTKEGVNAFIKEVEAWQSLSPTNTKK